MRTGGLKKSAVSLSLLAVGCGAVLATAGRGDSRVVAQRQNTNLRIGWPSDLVDLDPQTSQDSFTRPALYFAYDTLVSRDSSGNIVPRLAQKWSIAPRRVVLTLRPGITCADGTPITAQVVAANFARVKDPATKAPLTASFLGSTSYTVAYNNKTRTVTINSAAFGANFVANLSYFPAIVCPTV